MSYSKNQSNKSSIRFQKDNDFMKKCGKCNFSFCRCEKTFKCKKCGKKDCNCKKECKTCFRDIKVPEICFDDIPPIEPIECCERCEITFEPIPPIKPICDDKDDWLNMPSCKNINFKRVFNYCDDQYPCFEVKQPLKCEPIEIEICFPEIPDLCCDCDCEFDGAKLNTGFFKDPCNKKTRIPDPKCKKHKC